MHSARWHLVRPHSYRTLLLAIAIAMPAACTRGPSPCEEASYTLRPEAPGAAPVIPAPRAPSFDELSPSEHLAHAEESIVRCDQAARRLRDGASDSSLSPPMDSYLASTAGLTQARRHLDAIPRGAPEWRGARRAGHRLDRHDAAARRLRRQLRAIAEGAAERALDEPAPSPQRLRPSPALRSAPASTARAASSVPTPLASRSRRGANATSSQATRVRAPSQLDRAHADRGVPFVQVDGPRVESPRGARRRAPEPLWIGHGYPCAENGSCYGDLSVETGRPRTVHVRAYTRGDGTYVRGHYRSRPRR